MRASALRPRDNPRHVHPQYREPVMSLLDAVHEHFVRERRVRLLADRCAEQIPQGARVLDVGCGDGQISRRIGERRPDIELRGIDVLVREDTSIPVQAFDGQTIPSDNESFDVILFVDMLHHTDDPMILLREAARVARHAIVIKDHTVQGILAEPTLRFMDRAGNARHGVVLPYNYWTEKRWRSAFQSMGFAVASWNGRLGLFPWPASWLFERSLHFLARLVPDARRLSGPSS